MTTRHRFIWVVRFAAVVLTATFVYTGSLFLVPRRAKVLGWTETERAGAWYVSQVDPQGPAGGRLLRGDRLLAWSEDESVAIAGTAIYRRAVPSGGTYTLRIARGGQPQSYTLIAAVGDSTLGSDLAWVAEALVWCVPALFIGFVRPEQPLARLAFVGASVASVPFLGNIQGFIFPIALNPLHVALGYHFFYRFPGGVPGGALWRALLIACYGGAAVATARIDVVNWAYLTQGATAATHLIADHPLWFLARDRVFAGTNLLAIAGMVLVIPRNYRLLTDDDRRRRVRLVLYASLIGLLPRLALAVVRLFTATGGAAPNPLFNRIGVFSTAAIPISVAYAIVRHRAFDIDVVLRRGMQYLLARRALQALLTVPTAALVYTVVTSRDQTIAQLVTHDTGYLFWMAVAAGSLRFRRPLRLWLDRKFFRDQYDRERIFEGLLNELGRIDSTSEFSAVLTTQLEMALHPKTLFLWYGTPRALDVIYAGAEPAMAARLRDRTELLAVLERAADIIELPGSSDHELASADVQWLARLGVHVMVPIVSTEARLIGVIMLGEKKSEAAYTTSDRRFLGAIARQVAVMRENLDLKARIGEEHRIRHEVLAAFDDGLLNLLKECPTCGTCFDSSATSCDRDGEPLTLTLPVERTIDDRYRLDRVIGKGGMGAVYEARDVQLNRAVAVKVMVAHGFGDEQAARRFRREAQAAARLTHRNIIRVYDFGTVARRGAYIVMERLTRATLRAEIDRSGSLPPPLVAEIFAQLLAGVAAAHEKGIVHRDLKPENVFIERPEGGTPIVKVLDFGLAKLRSVDARETGTALTETGVVVGTFGYMAPEQLMGSIVDERSDVFALGVILIEALTGRRPFQGGTYQDILAALLQPYHLPGSSPEIRAVDAIVQRCIAKEPTDRVASIADLERELIPALRACPPLEGSTGAVVAGA